MNKQNEVNAYFHTHWDREWYMEYERYRLRLIEVFDNVLIALKNNKLDWFWFDGQVAAILDYLEIKKEKKDEIKNFIKKKRLFIGPYYVSSDSFLVSCEFYLRNIEYGIKKSLELGCDDFVFYIADSFGHSKFLPFIAKYFNIDYAILWRGIDPDVNSFFNWDGLITHNLKRGYFQNQLLLNIANNEKTKLILNELKKIDDNKNDFPIILPLGGDHLNIPDNIKNTLNDINKNLKEYKITTKKTIIDIFKNLDYKKLKIYNNKEFRNNQSTFILDGVLSTRNDIKKENAKTQFLLSGIAEPFIAFLNMLNIINNTYEQEFEYATYETLKNHAHDSLYGCNIDNVNQEIKLRYKKVQTISKSIINRQITTLEENGDNITVFNFGRYNFSGVIKLKTDKKIKNLYIEKKEKGFALNKLYNPNDIPMTEDYKSIYTYLIPVKNIKPFSVTLLSKNDIIYYNDLYCNQNSIENKFIKIEIDENNKINIIDKSKKKRYDNAFIIKDVGDIGDSYNFGPLKNDKCIFGEIKKYKIIKEKGLFCKLKTVFSIKIPKNTSEKGRTKGFYDTKINVDFILESESKILKIRMNFVNKSKNHKLQIGIQKENNTQNEIYCEDLLGIVKRKVDLNYNIYDKIPSPKGIELKTNTIPFNRFLHYNNIGIITKGIHSAELNKEGLFLDIIRSTGVISNPKNPSRGTSAGPPLDAFKSFMLDKIIKTQFGICFDENPNSMYKYTNEYYNPTLCCFSNIKSQELFNLTNENIQLLNIKSKENKINVRLFNSSCEEQETILNYKNVKNRIIVFKPHEVKIIVMV